MNIHCTYYCCLFKLDTKICIHVNQHLNPLTPLALAESAAQRKLPLELAALVKGSSKSQNPPLEKVNPPPQQNENENTNTTR